MDTIQGTSDIIRQECCDEPSSDTCVCICDQWEIWFDVGSTCSSKFTNRHGIIVIWQPFYHNMKMTEVIRPNSSIVVEQLIDSLTQRHDHGWTWFVCRIQVLKASYELFIFSIAKVKMCLNITPAWVCIEKLWTEHTCDQYFVGSMLSMLSIQAGGSSSVSTRGEQ